MTLQKRPDKKITYSYPDNFDAWNVARIGGDVSVTLICPFTGCKGMKYDYVRSMADLQDDVETHNEELHSTVVHESIPRHAPDPYKGPLDLGQVTTRNASRDML